MPFCSEMTTESGASSGGSDVEALSVSYDLTVKRTTCEGPISAGSSVARVSAAPSESGPEIAADPACTDDGDLHAAPTLLHDDASPLVLVRKSIMSQEQGQLERPWCSAQGTQEPARFMGIATKDPLAVLYFEAMLDMNGIDGRSRYAL